MKALHHGIITSLLLALVLSACKTGPVNLFKTTSPYELYQRKLQSAGLDKTAMGKAWMQAGQESLSRGLRINLPYKEQGYFPLERVPATALRFNALRGQRLDIRLTTVPATGYMVYMDLWAIRGAAQPKLIASADTLSARISIDVEKDTTFLLRLQPELLKSGSYTLEIVSGPSLAFPVKAGDRKRIESLFGVGRDANTRKHEGIDIFGTRRTPVLASADGQVTRVGENNLGGLVVMMRPNDKDYTLYYAHLDKQLAREGQEVKTGDTLGLMGNTGNAKTTPPHLHFGIYTSTGAVDPLPFVNPRVIQPKSISVPTTNLNATLRSSRKTGLRGAPDEKATVLKLLDASTVVRAEAATSNWYKATLPDGSSGFVQGRDLASASPAIRKLKLVPQQLALLDAPHSGAPLKMMLDTGTSVNLLGRFQDYMLVEAGDAETGWVKAENKP